jgi:hypothetical protein
VAEQTYVVDGDMERALRDLGQYVAYPGTPDLAAAVRSRLTQLPPPRRRARLFFEPGWQRAVAVAVLALVVLIGAGLAISPDTRDAVAERLGLKGVTIEHVLEAPTPGPTATPSPVPTPGAPTSTPVPPGAALGLGTRTSLLEARTQVGFPLQVPSDLGPPDAVYVADPGQVSLVYAPRANVPPAPQAASVGVLLTEFRATIDEQLLFGKGLPPTAHLEEVRVAGQRGFWISGAPHTFFVRDARGQIKDERSRLAGNTLLFENNGVTVRIESALDRDAALRIAESLR